jgi:glycosyltransferase involved in cell wall biosynthesis
LKPLKILLVIDNLSTGGAQRQIVNLALGLKRRKHCVEVFCYSQGDLLATPLVENDIPIHWEYKNGRYSLGVILNLARLLRQGAFDLAISFLATPNFYLVTANMLNGRRIPVVVSERFTDLPSGVPFTERFARAFYRFADHVVVNSHHQRENLAAKYPHLKNRLSTIYNGYDLDVFTPGPESSNGRVDGSDLKLLTIASVSRYKNGLCLVEALKILKEKYAIQPQLDWIGHRATTGDYLTYLEEMYQKIDGYQLGEQWHWLDQRTDIVDQLQAHDVLVHPSYGEGLPNVVCEALSCGRPVIVSDVLDHARLVQDGESGYLFDLPSPADLAEKIYQFSRLAPDERCQMGHRGRAFAETNLSLNHFIDCYEGLFVNLRRGQE